MSEQPGFDVRPDALRAVAARLRDDTGSVRGATDVVDEAVTAVRGAGYSVAAAVGELHTALDRIAGAARRDLEALAAALDATALGYQADDQHGSASFGGVLSRRLSP